MGSTKFVHESALKEKLGLDETDWASHSSTELVASEAVEAAVIAVLCEKRQLSP